MLDFSAQENDRLMCESSVLDLQGKFVQKVVNSNPGLKVKRGTNFPSMKIFSTAFVLCSLTSHKLTTEGQIMYAENLIKKLQKLIQNPRLYWVSLNGCEQPGPGVSLSFKRFPVSKRVNFHPPYSEPPSFFFLLIPQILK